MEVEPEKGGDGLLRVGMSVPAHRHANEGLEGYGNRGWLKPPPPEEGYGK